MTAPIPLPSYKHRSGCYYYLVRRSETTALYAVSYMPRENKDYRATGYDVFRIRTSQARTMGGALIPARECFPHDEAFGSWAWSYQTLEGAAGKFNELEQSPVNRAAA